MLELQDGYTVVYGIGGTWSVTLTTTALILKQESGTTITILYEDMKILTIPNERLHTTYVIGVKDKKCEVNGKSRSKLAFKINNLTTQLWLREDQVNLFDPS